MLFVTNVKSFTSQNSKRGSGRGGGGGGGGGSTNDDPDPMLRVTAFFSG